MSGCIDAEELDDYIANQAIATFRENKKQRYRIMIDVLTIIRNFKAYDAVEVVRCKDCKWFDVYSEDICTHECGMIEPNPDCFCSYGERHKI